MATEIIQLCAKSTQEYGAEHILSKRPIRRLPNAPPVICSGLVGVACEVPVSQHAVEIRDCTAKVWVAASALTWAPESTIEVR